MVSMEDGLGGSVDGVDGWLREDGLGGSVDGVDGWLREDGLVSMQRAAALTVSMDG